MIAGSAVTVGGVSTQRDLSRRYTAENLGARSGGAAGVRVGAVATRRGTVRLTWGGADGVGQRRPTARGRLRTARAVRQTVHRLSQAPGGLRFWHWLLLRLAVANLRRLCPTSVLQLTARLGGRRVR